jgi:integrase
LRAIVQAEDLEPSLKQHWSCSLRQIAKAIGRPIETIPARWGSVRIAVAALHHAMAGSREKTLQNHKSNVRRALVWFAGEYDVPTRGGPLRAGWVALRQRIGECGDAARLSSLMRYCSGKDILPADVTETVLDEYMAYRAATTRLATDDAARRSIARSWNRCIGKVQGWPSRALDEPPIKGADGPSLSDFPPKLREDIESYLAGLGRARRSANGKRRRPCKPSSIRTRRAELVATVKTAARIVPMAELTDLKTLLKPDLVERVLNAYWEKDGERPGRFTIDLAWKLCSVAREAGVDAASLEVLGDIQAELETYRQAGLTPKNLTLIRQVLSPNVWNRVVNLPWVLLRKAELLAEHAPVKAAVTAQIAVAIAILSVAPVRLGNLGSIRLKENLIRPGGIESPYWLVFPDYDVKNHIPLEFALDQRVTDLIDTYINDYRPALLRGSNEPWLFPGEGRGRKTLTTLSTQITERILDATGVRMTTHQFRHAAAAILLRHRPGEYELVRRLLGHRNVETTKNFYCGLETTQATEIYGDIIRRQLTFEPEER